MNKQKAWRLGAESINQQRQFDRRIPTARQQNQTAVKIKGSTWLLDGLLIRAGIVDPLPPVASLTTADNRVTISKRMPTNGNYTDPANTFWSRTKKWLGIK